MSTPLGIQYPNAWYHVMNRGRCGDETFTEANPDNQEELKFPCNYFPDDSISDLP